MKLLLLSLSVTSLLLAGCAATVQKSSEIAEIKATSESTKYIAMNVTGSQKITTSGDWDAFKGEWISCMGSAAKAIGAEFAPQEGEPKPTGDPGILVIVRVADYRYISPGSRFVLGVMTGNAFVDSSVQFVDLKTGSLLGERTYNTSSSAWQGIFAPMTDKQIQAITTEIATEIKIR